MSSTAVATSFARLQLESGLYGVTKIKWRDWPRRNWLSVVCLLVFLGLAIAVTLGTTRSVTDEPTSHEAARWIALIGLLAYIGVRILLEMTVLRLKDGEVGQWDRKLAEPWWTGIHTLTGVVLGLWLTPFFVVVGLTIAWELFEISVPGFGDEEINGNRLIDTLVAWGGWFVAAGIAAWASDVPMPFLP